MPHRPFFPPLGEFLRSEILFAILGAFFRSRDNA